MQIIKLSATESTNTYLKLLASKQNLPDFTVVITDNQTKGKGQINSSWDSEPGNNLTFSVLKHHQGFNVKNQFLVSTCVSLAIYEVLNDLKLPRVKVKWPNDILSGNLKVCGILIENTLKGQEVMSSVIGIGLNVNQTVFSKNLKATSVKLELKKEQKLESLLVKIMDKLQFYLPKATRSNEVELMKAYKKALFRIAVPSTFWRPNGSIFMGIISDVTTDGKLKVKLEDDTYELFGLKEIKLLF